jgi:hypothetical protein
MKALGPNSNGCVLLVVEGHAACSAWPVHLGSAPDDGWCVLEQEEWEPFEAFRVRLSATLERLSLGGSAGPVVLVASRFWDVGALAPRRKIAVEILATLAQSGGGEFVLSHGHQHDGPPREALAALSAELSQQWADSTVSVTVRVEDRARRAEVRRASSPAMQAARQPSAT